jgi:hypothetical protein
MRKLINTRPSAGLIVGCVALVVALGGTAVGLPGKGSVDSGDIKQNAVKSKHIKNKQVKPGDLSAKARSPRAYAHVTGDNIVTPSLSRGIKNSMVTVENDIYCFNDVGFSPKHVQATVDSDNTTNVIIQATLEDQTECAGTEDASVRMIIADTSSAVIATNFFVAFD